MAYIEEYPPPPPWLGGQDVVKVPSQPQKHKTDHFSYNDNVWGACARLCFLKVKPLLLFVD